LLVDDVFTTGATMEEAARVLKEAGAEKIVGVVVAKASPGQDKLT
jgi:competence protein ComFC